jgi:hypothetical protein
LDQDQTEDIDGFGQQDQVPDYGTDDANDRCLPFKVHDDFYAGFSLACTMDEVCLDWRIIPQVSI